MLFDVNKPTYILTRDIYDRYVSSSPGPVLCISRTLPDVRAAAHGQGRFDLVVTASSAGGIVALKELLSRLPEDFPAPLVVVQHLCASSRYRSVLDEVLLGSTRLRVKWAEDGELLRAGTVYIAPQDRHTVVLEGGRIQVSEGEKINFFRPAADPLFASAAQVFGDRAVGIVLSGSFSDGSEGAAQLVAAGAMVFAQDAESCTHSSMPRAAIRRCHLTTSFTPGALGLLLASLITSNESLN
ncbi:MAG TPA: chemotaxis protein CheB [Terracidiphilus sp.]|nr:chemotaxis protein CheB [Terracidiphilus sp.]